MQIKSLGNKKKWDEKKLNVRLLLHSPLVGSLRVHQPRPARLPRGERPGAGRGGDRSHTDMTEKDAGSTLVDEEERGEQGEQDEDPLPCCYVCGEHASSLPGDRLLVDVCSCKHMTLHLSCQRRMVRSSRRDRPMHCPVCDEPYRNVTQPRPHHDQASAETLVALVVSNSAFSLIVVVTSRVTVPEGASLLSPVLLVAEAIAWCCVLVGGIRRLRLAAHPLLSPFVVSVLVITAWQPSVVVYLLVAHLALVECVALLLVAYLTTFLALSVLCTMLLVKQQRQQQRQQRWGGWAEEDGRGGEEAATTRSQLLLV